MNPVRLARIPAAAVAVAATVGAAAPVAAQTATPRPLAQATLATCKQAGQNMVTARLDVLGDLRNKVTASKTLTAAHRATLTNLVDSDRSGLSTLATTIQGDTTLAQCRSDVQSIVTRFRVYVLVVPQVHITIAADALQAADTTLAGLEQKLSTAIQNAHLNPGQQQRASEALTDYDTHVGNAAALIKGQADAVLALTPAGYPGTTTTLKSAHTNLESAHADLKAARADFDTIADILRLPAH